MNAQNLFMNHGVKVAVGALESDPGKAVLAHLNGSLSTGSNICDHWCNYLPRNRRKIYANKGAGN